MTKEIKLIEPLTNMDLLRIGGVIVGMFLFFMYAKLTIPLLGV